MAIGYCYDDPIAIIKTAYDSCYCKAGSITKSVPKQPIKPAKPFNETKAKKTKPNSQTNQPNQTNQLTIPTFVP